MKLISFLLFFPLVSLFSHDGLNYTCTEYSNTPYILPPQTIHILEIDPTLYEIKPVKALDNGIGRESVFSIATRHGAIASVNGGFFSIGGTFDGKACGTLKIVDWVALPVKPRGCIGWSKNHDTPKMDRLLVQLRLNEGLPFDGLNRPRQLGEMVLFTPNFHRTTLTNPDGEELIVIDDIITKVVKGGSTKIPENGYVVSIQENSPFFGTFTEGKHLSITTKIQTFSTATTPDEWASLDYIVGGTPLLIQGGKKITNFEAEKTIQTFLTNRHARTAVGILPNDHWLFVVVDKTGLFDGMTMDELSDFMLSLGCQEALNLDGGGSSTMVYEGAVKNSPHGDEDEGIGQATIRRVSDAIIVLPKSV